LREQLGAELEERDYAKQPLNAAELKQLFKNRDPREFLNSKSPAFKAKGLTGKKLSAQQAIDLMVEDPNLIKRPLVAVNGELIAGFDKERLKSALA
jgi:arsenate reductase-like glutaredoxin family protein